MKTLSAFALLGLLCPTLASAQGVVFVADVGDARLDVEVLRERVARETGRSLVRLGDEGSREALETVTLAHAGRGRWVLRHQRGTAVTWIERTDVAPATALEVLALAAIELLRATAVAPADPAFETRAGADLVDPFAARWDPLRTALDGELVRPFIARGGMVYVGVADPFARDTTAVHLLDPFAP